MKGSKALLAAKDAEIAALREALEPFAGLANGIPDAAHDAAPACRIGQDAKCPGTFTTINNGAFRRATAALSGSPAPDRMPVDTEWGTSLPLYAPDPAEAMRAKCDGLEAALKSRRIQTPNDEYEQGWNRGLEVAALLLAQGK